MVDVAEYFVRLGKRRCYALVAGDKHEEDTEGHQDYLFAVSQLKEANQLLKDMLGVRESLRLIGFS